MSQEKRSQIAQNLLSIHQEIKSLSRQYEVSEPVLLPVSKKQSVTKILDAYKCGERQFAESYFQEAVEKIKALPEDIIWHYIGHIQSNKLKVIAEHFDWIHTLASRSHAKKLNRYCQQCEKVMNVCIQINVDQEPQKSGIDIIQSEEINVMVNEIIDNCPSLQLKGLMCILAHTDNYDKQLASFLQLRTLQDELKARYGLSLDTLSMGMSADISAAIAAGSTILRVGQAVFGAR
ncbi:YggS family pyridoxal phosphate-dependent enzyme [Facilibium subflavum]|uniref:YggS family pyridoxal phosphate-dependent enzyme n=1 Tax=Facilibium subflavum TaxID=2219058 RepID=UPI000E65D0EC|nr:YggS family pyridoxal phosphate-dependent enzyme [Facilibium subflavum]